MTKQKKQLQRSIEHFFGGYFGIPEESPGIIATFARGALAGFLLSAIFGMSMTEILMNTLLIGLAFLIVDTGMWKYTTRKNGKGK